MENLNIYMGQRQIHDMALSIISDIKDYVEKHSFEYETFLAANKEGGEDNVNDNT